MTVQAPTEGCFQFVKDKEFESNSQPYLPGIRKARSCFQFVKDKEFESNSQPPFAQKGPF